jgi:tetratricopeptide repeat protein 8
LVKSPTEVQLLLGLARVYDLLNDSLQSSAIYNNILTVNACNVEAIASLAAYNFYTDYPEQSLRYYRRLLQLGVNNVEIWNNLGLASYYAG